MRAYLVLKKGGQSPASVEAYPTSATIKERMASSEEVRKAETAAEQLGFTVVNATPLHVTIEGRKEHFERVFSSRLEPAGSARKQGKSGARKKPPVREAATKVRHWTWQTPPAVPAEMGEVVAEVVLPQATALH